MDSDLVIFMWYCVVNGFPTGAVPWLVRYPTYASVSYLQITTLWLQQPEIFIFSCSHFSCGIFILISYSLLFVHSGHANFDFNLCPTFTECCFSVAKKFEWSKSLFIRFPPLDSLSHQSCILYRNR